MADAASTIAFQGEPGAYSDLACRAAYSAFRTLPCASFEDAFSAVESGAALLGMIPIENSVAGRVADIHQLLPETGLHIVAEHFQRVEHQLLAMPSASLATVKRVHSHVQALSQCRNVLRSLGLQPVAYPDTAGAAAHVARLNNPEDAAIASALAGEIYGLQVLREGVEDHAHNTTRFIVLARDPEIPAPHNGRTITTFVFSVRNVPAALYKAMGGFATNGVNMTKIESYMVGGEFAATQFYADIDGHPEHHNVRLALEELDFFSRSVRILGVYPAHAFRERR